MRCAICGTKIDSVDEAIDEGWISCSSAVESKMLKNKSSLFLKS